MTYEPADQQVIDDPGRSRYEASIDGQLVGVIEYAIKADRLVMHHAEVNRALEGRGIGGRMVAAALEDVRRRGLTVVPQCTFVSDYIRQHSEYRDLVADCSGPADA